jgi:hypothetical protein
MQATLDFTRSESHFIAQIGNDKFEAYHKANPAVWTEFEKLANKLWDSGVRHYGSKSIMEVIRYHTSVDTRPNSQFKVNNNYTAQYARLYINKYPERKEFFELRERIKEA